MPFYVKSWENKNTCLTGPDQNKWGPRYSRGPFHEIKCIKDKDQSNRDVNFPDILK